MPTPPKPAPFHPDIPPPGFEKHLISFWRDRPVIDPRLQLVHTNGASREGSIEASLRWADQPGSGHTIPHCQFDRDGRAALILPSNRKGIANYRAADFSLGFETADTGYLDDPTISAFTPEQAESVAVACAYYSVLHAIPLAYPTAWDGSGTASHTEPFGYPYWTNSRGKICPGDKKKAQVRELILPRAREIVTAWMQPQPNPAPNPTPTPTPTPDTPLSMEDSDMPRRAGKLHNPGGPGDGGFWVEAANGKRRHVGSHDDPRPQWQGHEARLLEYQGLQDSKTGRIVYDWDQIQPVDEAFLNTYVGRP